MRLTGPEKNLPSPAVGLFFRIPRLLRLLLSGVVGLTLVFVVASNSTHKGMRLSRVAANYIRGWSAQPEHIQIGLKFKDLQQLAFVREQALDKGILISSEKDFVPARIQYGDREYKAKIRLKGDWVYDNLEGDKWSFRVVLKGDNALFGMKQFSLHQPKVRNYIYEWIFHQALKREDIIPLRTSFVRVSLNGKDLGVYALEEHFDKRLLEHNSRREGVILKFNEDVRWRDAREFWPRPSPTNLSAMEVAEIDAFQSGSVLSDSTLRHQFLLAESLLEQFRTGQLRPRQVFDTERMAAYFAIVDLMGGLHALSWHNMRFYYNPVTSLLEPIGFDAMAGTPTGGMIGTAKYSGSDVNSLMKRLFADELFYRQYLAASLRLSTPAYLDSLLDQIDDSLQANLSIIYSEYPDFKYSPDVLYKNQEVVAKTLNPIRCLNAYVQKADDRELVLEMGNIQAFPIEVTGLSLGNLHLAPASDDGILEPFRTIAYREMVFATPPGVIWTDSILGNLKVIHHIRGVPTEREIGVIPWPRLNTAFMAQDIMRQKPNFENLKFLQVNRIDSTVTFVPGKYILNESIIIPGGYRVLASGGTNINLLNSARILSHSPVTFDGSEDKLIVIRSSDSTGQGLIVIDAGSESTLDNVIFENLQRPSQGAWGLTGAVTFYNSPVRIDSCIFRGLGSEDCLNITRSEFTMDNSLFANCSFDAFDGDFVTGTVTNTHFRNIGNDGVDISGSKVQIRDISVIRAGDKSVSVGEESIVSGSGIEVAEANIGVASKDGSTVHLSNVRIRQCRIGFAAYRKKSEYTEAAMVVDSAVLSDTDIPYLIETGSTLSINGELVTGTSAHVYDSLYGNSDATGLF